MSPKKVFISYAHETETHNRNVRILADSLRAHGVDCTIEQYEHHPSEGWSLWMRNRITASDFVIIVFSQLYIDTLIAEIPENVRKKGARTEAIMLYQENYERGGVNEKIIPVVFDDRDTSYMPIELRGYTYNILRGDIDYECIYRRITGREVPMSPLGEEVAVSCDNTINEGDQYSLSDSNRKNDSTTIVTSETDTIPIELKLNIDLDTFTDEEKIKLTESINRLLGISDVKITRIRKGSVLVTVEVPARLSEKLLIYAQNGYFEDNNVVDAYRIGFPKGKVAQEVAWVEQPERKDLCRVQSKQGGQIRRPDVPEILLYKWQKQTGEDEYGTWLEFAYKNALQRMRLIKPGEFLMGSPDNEAERDSNEKQHNVIITKGYWLADTTCTQELWQVVMGENPSYFKGPQRPVDNVSWNDCQKFLSKINSYRELPGISLCLPTEAQWEYACRAGSQSVYCFGDNEDSLGDYAWYAANLEGSTQPVGKKRPNKFGLYDMHGNVLEWCRDWYGNYKLDQRNDPTGPETGSLRVLRGGTWFVDARYCRCAYRYADVPVDRLDSLSFRVVFVP